MKKQIAGLIAFVFLCNIATAGYAGVDQRSGVAELQKELHKQVRLIENMMEPEDLAEVKAIVRDIKSLIPSGVEECEAFIRFVCLGMGGVMGLAAIIARSMDVPDYMVSAELLMATYYLVPGLSPSPYITLLLTGLVACTIALGVFPAMMMGDPVGSAIFMISFAFAYLSIDLIEDDVCDCYH